MLTYTFTQDTDDLANAIDRELARQHAEQTRDAYKVAWRAVRLYPHHAVESSRLIARMIGRSQPWGGIAIQALWARDKYRPWSTNFMWTAAAYAPGV